MEGEGKGEGRGKRKAGEVASWMLEGGRPCVHLPSPRLDLGASHLVAFGASLAMQCVPA